MQALQAPWRMEYLRSTGTAGSNEADGAKSACFLCESAAAGPGEWRERLILWKSDHCVVQLNRYPYVSGHLLVSPLAHEQDLGVLDDAQAGDLMRQTRRAIAVLRRAVSPQGFNVGMNLGRSAGAGVPGHLHQHIVPRWAGDVNFFAVIGEVRLVTEALDKSYDILHAAAEELDASNKSDLA